MKTKKIAYLILFGIIFKPEMSLGWVDNTLSFSRVFIENKGQFILPDNFLSDKILYEAEFGPRLYFTKSGIIYSMSKSEKMTEEEKKIFFESGSEERRKKEKDEKEQTIIRTYDVNMEWIGANPNVELVADNKVDEYWNYIDPANPNKSIDRISGYKKITYKNLYPNIDVEYLFHEQDGIKYTLILHPNADASLVKMKYSGAQKIYTDSSGNICFSTEAGSITDHAPETFYESGRESISSSFHLEKNIVSFNLGTYDNTKTVIIDPWMNSSLVPSTTVVEISVDGANNVYIYGFTGLQNYTITLGQYVQKYNPAGSLIWTFNFTQAMRYDQQTGDISVDPTGNAYVTNGFFMVGYFIADCMQSKLDPSGTLMWNIQSPNLYENWRNAMNCDYTQLVQVGVGNGCCGWGKGSIINTTTGAESGMFNPAATGDIVAASYGKNGYLYILSVKDDYAVNPPPNGPHLGCLDPATGFSVVFNNLYPVSAAFVDGFNTGYGTFGFNGIAAGCSYLYVFLGATLEKRDLNTGALIGSITVPGGVQHGNAGTAVDECGNVYVGSSQGVYVYDSNLNLLTTFATPNPVLDIVIGKGGIFYVCGGVNSTSNVGFVAQFSMTSVCNPITITTTPNSCGPSNVGTATATAIFCSAPYTYLWSTSPAQTTQTATGLGGGTYTVIVTGSGACNETDTAVAIIPAGLLITSVPPPTNVSCFGGNNGSANATATGGTSPYTYLWNPIGQTSQTVTGLSAGTYTVLVTDAGGCTGSQTVTITQPPVLTATANATSAASCGSNNGSATVTASGGTGVYTYLWNPTGASTAVATGLTAGNYSVTVIDANGCTVINTVTVASAGSITAIAGPNSTICAGQTATLTSSGGTNYVWSNGQTTTSITITPTTNTSYSVIVSSGSCVDTAFVTVTVNQSPILSVSGNTVLCIGDTATLTASGGTNYFWNTGSTTAVINVSPGTTTTYSVVTSSANGCTAASAITVTVSPPPVAVANNTTICAGQNATLTASGGATYSWSNGITSNPILVSPTSNTTYTVIVSIGSCSDTASATVVVNPNPTATAWSNVTITQGQSTTLSASGGGTYIWSNGATGSNISVSPLITTWYCVTVSTNNCIDTACVTVYVEPIDCSYADDRLFVPDAFSPNGDTKNDFFGVYYPNISCIKEFMFIIYDRWGEKVFEADNMSILWDGTYNGKAMNTAVFVYYMKATFIDDNEVIRKGNISLIR